MPTLLLLHGFTGSGASWDALRAQFPAQYTIITPDIVGHGSAPKPEHIDAYSMQQAAEAILAQVAGNFHLLGYSMGGRLALYMAVHYPQRVQSLILESASPGLKTQAEREDRKQRDDALADRIEQNGIAWFAEFWESLPLWDNQSAALKRALRAQRLQNDPRGLANSLRGMGTGVMPSLWDDLPRLSLPVLLLVGALDAKFLRINREMATRLPNAALHILPQAGHTVHAEQPGAYVQQVQEFLSQNR